MSGTGGKEERGQKHWWERFWEDVVPKGIVPVDQWLKMEVTNWIPGNPIVLRMELLPGCPVLPPSFTSLLQDSQLSQ